MATQDPGLVGVQAAQLAIPCEIEIGVKTMYDII